MVKEGTKCGANKASANNKSHVKKSKKIRQKQKNTTLQSSIIGSISECNLTCKIFCTKASKEVAFQINISPKSEQKFWL